MLKFYELAPSPNNTKLHMALRYKGIPFEVVSVHPADRQVVLEVSGQELTPVIQDKGIVLNDSESILHYLDANYRDAPRLFPGSRAGRKACDRWREDLDQSVAVQWAPVFFHAIGMREDLDSEALERFQEALASLDEKLGDRDSFHDDPEMVVCDLSVAVWATYALPGEGLLERVGLFRKFKDVFAVEPGSLPNLERFLGPWNERLA